MLRRPSAMWGLVGNNDDPGLPTDFSCIPFLAEARGGYKCHSRGVCRHEGSKRQRWGCACDVRQHTQNCIPALITATILANNKKLFNWYVKHVRSRRDPYGQVRALFVAISGEPICNMNQHLQWAAVQYKIRVPVAHHSTQLWKWLQQQSRILRTGCWSVHKCSTVSKSTRSTMKNCRLQCRQQLS